MVWADAYLGQRGLASKYFIEEVDAKVDPLSPDNKMFIATGPLTGTGASTSGRYSVITKGPLTGTIACSNGGGHFGPELKMAGWDMIIFEGKAAEPVYLFIRGLIQTQAPLGRWKEKLMENPFRYSDALVTCTLR